MGESGIDPKAIEAEVGLSLEAVRWAAERGEGGYAAWKAARGGSDAAAYRRLALALRLAFDRRERLLVLEGSSLGEPVVITTGKADGPRSVEGFADPLPCFDLEELGALGRIDAAEGREAAREKAALALRIKKAMPGARLQ